MMAVAIFSFANALQEQLAFTIFTILRHSEWSGIAQLVYFKAWTFRNIAHPRQDNHVSQTSYFQLACRTDASYGLARMTAFINPFTSRHLTSSLLRFLPCCVASYATPSIPTPPQSSPPPDCEWEQRVVLVHIVQLVLRYLVVISHRWLTRRSAVGVWIK